MMQYDCADNSNICYSHSGSVLQSGRKQTEYKPSKIYSRYTL